MWDYLQMWSLMMLNGFQKKSKILIAVSLVDFDVYKKYFNLHSFNKKKFNNCTWCMPEGENMWNKIKLLLY